jgi:ATP-dependent protease ClpP protease subunit
VAVVTTAQIKGTVVADDDKWIYDWIGIESVCPGDISAQLKKADGDDVTFIVNSGGGDVFAGNEINYLISQYRGMTRADIVGIAASIATVICCGADTVRMSPGAQYMIHNVSGSAQGDFHEMDKASRVLANANTTISNTYRLKTGMTEKCLLELMDSETWLNAQQALKYGFIDEIIGDNGTLSAGKISLNNNCFANILSDEAKQAIRNQVKNPQGDVITDAGLLILKNKILLERMRGETL